MKSQFALSLLCSLLLAGFSHAQPELQNAEYSYQTQQLTLTFSQNLDNGQVSDGDLIFGNDSFPDNGYHQFQVMNELVDIMENQLIITLNHPGLLGIMRTDLDGLEYNTWGQNFTAARYLELAPEMVYCAISENLVYNENGESNLPAFLHNLVEITFTGQSPVSPTLEDAGYDKDSGILTLQFDEAVLFSNAAEDRAGLDGSPGNASLDAGEDANGNGVLDFQKSVFFDAIFLSDGTQTFKLKTQSGWFHTTVLNTENLPEIALQLTPENRIQIDSMDEEDLEIILDPWAFTSISYMGSDPEIMPVTETGYSDPVQVDSVNYDMGRNRLSVSCDHPIMEASGAVTNSGFIVHTPAGDFTLNSGYVVTSQNGVRITISLEDQLQIENAIDEFGDDDIQLSIEPYAFLGDNQLAMLGATLNLEIIPETMQNKAPELESASYEAETNSLVLNFDVRIAINVHHDGIFLGDENNWTPVEYESINRVNTNRTLVLTLSDKSAYDVERNLANVDNVLLNMAQATVFQQNVENPNRPIENFEITWNDDPTPPTPAIIRYEPDVASLYIHWNKAVAIINDPPAISINGVELDWDLSVSGPPSITFFELTAETASALEALSNSDKVNPLITIEAKFVQTPAGIANQQLTDLEFDDDLSGQGGVESLISGWGKTISVKPWRKFHEPAYDLSFYWRRSTEHANIFVAEDQLKEYAPNHGNQPLTESDLNQITEFIEDSTPADPEMGAYDLLRNLFVRQNFPPGKLSIHIMDMLDHVGGVPGNDTNRGFIVPSRYVRNLDNQGEFFFLDSHPQTFSEQDNAEYQDAEDDWITSDHQTGLNAVANLIGQWLVTRLDYDEKKWVREGMCSLAEYFTTGEASFYGAGLSCPLGNSLVHFGGLQIELQTKVDYWNSYLFMDYLLEHYSGNDLMQFITNDQEDGIEGMQNAVNSYRHEHPLEEPYQSHSIQEIFLDYAVACMLDASNEIHGNRFQFENVEVGGLPYRHQLRWRDQNPPPYVFTEDAWSFHSSYSSWHAFSNNPLLDPLGSLYLDFANSIEAAAMIIRDTNTSTEQRVGEYLAESVPLDYQGSAEIEMSIPGWEFGYEDEADYSTLHLITCTFNTAERNQPELVVSNEFDYFFAPRVYASVVSQTSVRLNFDLPWWEMGFEVGGNYQNPKQKLLETKRNRDSWMKQLVNSNEIDNEGGFAGFNVYRRAESEENFTLIAQDITELTYLDEGLTPRRGYTYNITANYLNPDGESVPASAFARPISFDNRSSVISYIDNNGIYGDPNMHLPSFEYPAGSGKYYLWEGRFWFGGIVGGETFVSSADYGEYEFAPVDENKIGTIIGNDIFHTSIAYTDYSDEPGHTPSGVHVNQVVKSWQRGLDEALSNSIVIKVTIENTGERGEFRDSYASWVFDADVGTGYGGNHMDDHVSYQPGRRLAYMYDGDDPGSPESDIGEFGEIPGYIGLAYVQGTARQYPAHFAWWNWEEDPGTDEEQYAFMNGTAARYNNRAHMPGSESSNFPPFDYRMMLSIGPYDLEAGETLEFTVAGVMGSSLQELEQNTEALYAFYDVQVDESLSIPKSFSIGKAYPNPFNPSFTLPFSIPEQGDVTVGIFNVLGQLVYAESAEFAAGQNSFHFDSINKFAPLSTGIYLLKVEYGNQEMIQRIMLMR